MKLKYFCLVILIFIGLCHSVSQATMCTESGRFPSDENHDCRDYVICIRGGLTNFTHYKITCPQGFIYSHLEQKCTNTTNYKCYPSFNCTTVSNFSNPESEDCSTYISCLQEINSIATARLIQCSDGTIFNSTIGECLDRNQTTCYTGVVKPVITRPIDEASVDTVNIIHKHIIQTNNAFYNNIKVSTLVIIYVLLNIV